MQAGWQGLGRAAERIPGVPWPPPWGDYRSRGLERNKGKVEKEEGEGGGRGGREGRGRGEEGERRRERRGRGRGREGGRQR